jgi:hypothetical protein
MSIIESAEAPITNKNIISKLCFVRYGGGLDRFGERFQTSLAQSLIAEGDNIVSRPTITGWFRKEPNRSLPTRLPALVFLRRVLDEIEYSGLEADRKKVHVQIQTFLKNRIPSSSDYDLVGKSRLRVVASERDTISINAVGTTAAAPRLASLEGIYFVYHARLTEDYKGQFAQEVIRIFRKGRNLQFDLWYLKDGQHVEKYNGVIFLFGTMLWFIGSTNKTPDRLRTMIFRDIHSEGKKYTDLRCGLMMSDIPTPSSPDPVACRVVLYRLRKRPDDIYKFSKENVVTFKRGERLKGAEGEIIRLIDNAVTALSSPLSKDAARDTGGNPIIDNVLKVDQHTVEKVSDFIFDI